MAEEDVLRLEAAERATRWSQTQERVNAERLTARAEVAEAPERVAADEDSLCRKPERDLPPEPSAHDRQHDERRTRNVRERRHVEGNAETLGDRSAVALVTVDELDDSGRLTEGADPLVEARAVDDVRQPDASADPERMRRALEALSLEMPAESVIELFTETELHGNTIAVAQRNSTSNVQIADRLERFASLLDLSGASSYSVRAYRRAAELIRETKAPVAELVQAGRVRELRGIGPGIEARLRELLETGRIAELDELESEVSPELVGLGRFIGLGPKRAVEIGRALGVRTAEEFREAAAAGRLAGVPGIGPKTEAQADRRARPGAAAREARPAAEPSPLLAGGDR